MMWTKSSSSAFPRHQTYMVIGVGGLFSFSFFPPFISFISLYRSLSSLSSPRIYINISHSQSPFSPKPNKTLNYLFCLSSSALLSLSHIDMVMAASQEPPAAAAAAVAGQGIKLFGTTITLCGRQVAVKLEEEEQLQQKQNKFDHATLMDKRPDKIIPCPRCKSMETKFCYFNNYNVNQPRHFCKGCQRYWTAGGAQRNVPVGAGRRKAKPPGRVGGLIGGLPEGYLFDDQGSSDHGVHHQFELEGMVMDEWQLTAAANDGGFHQVFPMKRRRISCSGGQPY